MELNSLDIPNELGPWKIIKFEHIKIDTIIALVKLNDKLNKTLDHSEWVLKIKNNVSHEFFQIMFLKKYNIKNSVIFPKLVYHLCGSTKHYTWYAMKKYNYILEKKIYYINDWKNIAQCGIQFMQSLHSHNHIYSDFKFDNVFFDENINKYVFADYDSVEHISNIKLSEYSNDFKFYYISKGGELSQPYKSFKFDLLAFGYLLINLLRNGPKFKFEDLCDNYRKHSVVTDEELNELITLRNTEILNVFPGVISPALLEYFKIVAEYDWNAKVSNDVSWYQKLENLFV